MLITVIILISIIQSIFGVGILLFGTPILLILGYEFGFILSILLPISLFVNLLQIIPNNNLKQIDYSILKNFILFSLPFVIIFLLIILNAKSSNVSLYVGLLLVIISLEKKSKFILHGLNYLVKSQKVYFILMGIVHGLTNLGGSLLALYFNKRYSDKYYIRTNIAVLYLLFALFQIFTLYISDSYNYIIELNTLLYVVIGIVVYFISNR
uniref:TSUP family transporter n=1 Tax=Arcobacter sp. TaxID=1872629 RepID=UPI003D10E8AD